MGACGSSLTAEEKANLAKSKQVDAQGRAAQAADAEKLKLLLLGAGESGKSTLFRQMKVLFTDQHGFSQSELQAGIKVVYDNIISNMKVLLANCERFTPVQDTGLADELMSLQEGTVIDDATGDKFKAMWEDLGVQATWVHRSNFQVQDSLEYFMDGIDRIKADDYVPSTQDMLRYRAKTSGIVEAEYVISGVKIQMFDVGGQRNERRKWIHCFDNVTAVIFVAAISEYDEKLYEDGNTGRQQEALELWDEMCGSEWFRQKSMILFLNKRDVFRKKLLLSPFKLVGGGDERNVDYSGPEVEPGTPSAQDGTPEFEAVFKATSAYLTDLYRSVGMSSNPKRQIYISVTCATDTDQVRVIMTSVKDTILKRNLSDNGFM